MWDCGSGAQITKEHVFSDWLNGLPLLPPGGRWQIHMTRDGGREPITYSSPKLAQTVGRYCESCNTGWMSDIEAEVKPIATPLILGEPTQLTVPDQLKLATWATLRAYIIEASDIGGERNVLATGQDYEAMFRDQRPSTETLVHIARFAELAGIFVWPLYGRGWAAGGIELVQWSTTIVIGHLVMRVTGRDGGTPGKPSVIAPEHQGMSSLDAATGSYRIWTPADYTIRWPPPRQLVRTSIMDYAGETSPQLRASLPPPPECISCGTLHETNPTWSSGDTPEVTHP